MRLKHLIRLNYGDALPVDERVEGGAWKVFGSNGPVGDHDRRNFIGPGIVVGRKGSYGKVLWAQHGGFCIDTAYYLDERHTSADLRFVYYLLSSLRLDTGSRDSAVPGLDRSDAYRRRIPEHDVDTQKAIADFLDKETARIDQLIEKKQRLVELLGERESAAITSGVWGRLSPQAATKRSGNPFGHEIPSHWEEAQLKRLVKPDTVITYGIVQAGPMVEGGIPYIRTGDMSGRELAKEGYPTTAPEIAAKYARSTMEAGDLVIAIRATVGKCLKLPDELIGANLTQGTAKISPGPRVERDFLWYALRSSPAQAFFEESSKGATFKEITLDRLRRLVIPLPPKSEQIAISLEIDRLVQRIGDCRARIKGTIDRLKEYRAALITAAVTGQINVTRWGRTGEGDRRLEVIEGGLQGQASVPSPKPRASIAALVAAEIVHRHREQRRFGRVTLQKLLYLAEAHIGIDGCEGDYERRAAGPFDEELISRVEAEMRQAEFYAVRQDGRGERVEYTPLRKAGRHKADLGTALGDKSRELARLIDLFVPTETRFSEKIATIYAVWNDALIHGEQPSDERIIRGVREEWHVEKLKFSPEELAEGIAWIRKRGLEPKGSGPTTSTQGGLF